MVLDKMRCVRNLLFTSLILFSSSLVGAKITERSELKTGQDAYEYIDYLKSKTVPLDQSNNDFALKLRDVLNLFQLSSDGTTFTDEGMSKLSMLEKDQQVVLLGNLYLILYGGFTRLINNYGNLVSKEVNLFAHELGTRLTQLIDALNVNGVGVYPSTFAGRKARITVSLKCYKAFLGEKDFLSSEKEGIVARLISENKILSVQQIIGTNADGSGGNAALPSLRSLVLDRMQEGSDQFINQGKPVGSSTELLEEPGASWRSGEKSLRSLISLAKSVLSPYARSEKVRSAARQVSPADVNIVCSKLDRDLSGDITFAERVNALAARSIDGSLTTSLNVGGDNLPVATDDISKAANDNLLQFIGMIGRMVKSLDSKVTIEQRKSAYDAVNSYQLANNLPKETLDVWLALLSRTSLSSEILQEGSNIFLQMMDAATGSPVYLAVKESNEGGSVKYRLTISRTGALGAANFKVAIYKNDFVILQWEPSEEKSGFFYLRCDSEGLLEVFSPEGRTTSFAGTLNTDSVNREGYFGQDESFFFRAYGSKDRLGLQNVERKGLISRGMDNLFRVIGTVEISKATGALELGVRSTLSAVPVLSVATRLAKARLENFQQDQTDPEKLILMRDRVGAAEVGASLNRQLEDFARAAEDALQEEESLGILLAELDYFLGCINDDEVAYKALRGNAGNAGKFSTIISGLRGAFVSKLNRNKSLSDLLTRIESLWSNVQNVEFRSDKNLVGLVVPDDGVTVAIKVVHDGENDVYLTSLPVKMLDGERYDLFAQEASATNPVTHFRIKRAKGLFGLISAAAGRDKYLTVKEAGTYSQRGGQVLSELTFADLEKNQDQNPLPFEVVQNVESQFAFEKRTERSGGKEINRMVLQSMSIDKAKNPARGYSYLAVNDDSDYSRPIPVVVNGGDGIDGFRAAELYLEVVVIDAFYQALGKNSLERDDVTKIKGYVDLLNYADTLERVRAVVVDVLGYLNSKRASFQDWNKFVIHEQKAEAMSDFLNKLNLVERGFAKEADRSVIRGLFSRIRSAFSADFAIPLESYRDPNITVALKWSDAAGRAYYLKVEKDKQETTEYQEVYNLMPKATSVSDADSQLKIIVSENDSVVIKFLSLNKFLSLDRNGRVSFVDAETSATSFVLEGQITKCALRVADSASLQKGSYLGVKSPSVPVLAYQGLDDGVKIKPLLGQQYFVIEQLSARDVELINAKKMCFLIDNTTWSQGGVVRTIPAEAQVGSNNPLLIALKDRLSAYDYMASTILDAATTNLDDKKLLVQEVLDFVVNITTKLNGRAWTLMVGDREAVRLFEETIMLKLKRIAAGEQSIGSLINMIESLWADGFVRAAGFKKGDSIAIEVSGIGGVNSKGYLNVVEKMYQGNKFYMLQVTNNFFGKTGQFKVSSSKDKVAFSSVAYPNMYIMAIELDSQARSFRPNTRLMLQSVDKKGVDDIDFTDSKLQGCMFSYDESTKALRSTVSDGTESGALVVIDKNDENFVKLDLNGYVVVDAQGSKSVENRLFIKKLDPFHSRLSEAYLAKTALEALPIFKEILVQDYINNNSQSELFVKAISDSFNRYRSNTAGWNSFLQNTRGQVLLNEFLVAVDASASLKANNQFRLVIDAVKGDFVTDLTPYENVYIALGWQDPSGKEHFLTKNAQGGLDVVDWSSTSKLSTQSQLKIQKDPSREDNSSNLASIAFDQFDSQGVSYPQYLIYSDGGVIGLSNQVGDSLFEVTGAAGRVSFKYAGQGNNEGLYFGVKLGSITGNDGKEVVTRQAVIASGGLSIDGSTSSPTSFQLFTIHEISKFERSVSLAASSRTTFDRIKIYDALLNQLSKNVEIDKLIIFVGELEAFVASKTSDENQYALLANSQQENALLVSVLSRLQELVSKNKDLAPRANVLVNSWADGYVGEPAEGTPENGDVIIFADPGSGEVWKVTPVSYRGEELLQLQRKGDDQVDLSTQFKVVTHKNKVAFESVSNPNYYLAVEVKDKRDDNWDVASRLTLSKLGKDSQGLDVVIGSPESSKFMFTLRGEGTVKSAFVLQSVLGIDDESANVPKNQVVIDVKDNNFARIKDYSVDATVQSALISFVPVTALHKRLVETRSIVIPRDNLEEHFKVLSQNYITNKETARLFDQSLSAFIRTQAEDAESWAAFLADLDAAESLNKILKYLEKKPDLFGGVFVNIQTLMSRGFVEPLKDDDYLVVTWSPNSGKLYYLNVFFAGQSPSKLITENVDQPGERSILRVKTVSFEGRPYIQLIAESNDADYVLSVSDTGVVSFVSASAVRDDQKKQTLFEYQGSLDRMSFRSFGMKSRGFLSRDAGNNIAAGKSGKPAGLIVDGVLVPGQFEQFKIEKLTSMSRQLITFSNPKPKRGEISKAITMFTQYPSLYKQKTRGELQSREKEVEAYINAIAKFVSNVTSNKELAAEADPNNDDQAFTTLLDIVKGLKLSTKMKSVLEDASLMWYRGYSQLISEFGLPDSGKNFVWLVHNEVVSEDDSNKPYNYVTDKAVISVHKSPRDGVMRLGVMDFDVIFKPYIDAGFSEEEVYEALVLHNDPFDDASQLKSLVGRNVFGVGYTDPEDKKSEELVLVLNKVEFPGNELDLMRWKDAAAYLAKGNFRSADSGNLSHFLISPAVDPDMSSDEIQYNSGKILDLATRSGGFVMKNKVLNNYLSVSREDGFIRSFVMGTNEDKKKVVLENVDVSALTREETFFFVEAGELHKLVKQARGAKDVKKMMEAYNNAMYAVKTQQELNWFAQELVRIVISKKTNREIWDKFFGDVDLRKSYAGLVKSFMSMFVDQRVGNLQVRESDEKLIQRQLGVLSQKIPVRFLQDVEMEESVLTFYEVYTNLKARLNNLDEANIDVFMQGVNQLINRRVELNLTNESNVPENNLLFAQRDVVEWLRSQVAYNMVIDSSGNSAAVLEAAEAISADYTFKDLFENLDYMIKNIAGFSPERAELFVKQASRLVTPGFLKRALAEWYSLAATTVLLRRGMSNQLRMYLDKPVSVGSEVFANLGIADGARMTYQKVMEEIIKKLVYPLEKGQTFIDLVKTQVDKIVAMDTNDEAGVKGAIGQLLGVADQWDSAIGQKLAISDVKDAIGASANSLELAAERKRLQKEFADKIDMLIRWMAPVSYLDNQVTQFEELYNKVPLQKGQAFIDLVESFVGRTISINANSDLAAKVAARRLLVVAERWNDLIGDKLSLSDIKEMGANISVEVARRKFLRDFSQQLTALVNWMTPISYLSSMLNEYQSLQKLLPTGRSSAGTTTLVETAVSAASQPVVATASSPTRTVSGFALTGVAGQSAANAPSNSLGAVTALGGGSVASPAQAQSDLNLTPQPLAPSTMMGIPPSVAQAITAVRPAGGVLSE